jgi:hypothetical protein
MTLVLTLVSRNFVLQVSDRLVTASETRQALDPLANKSIVCLARDAVVIAGYAGLASFGGQPTDEWIAERLLGTRLARPDSRGAFRFGRLVDYHRDLGQSVAALSAQLEGWPNRMLQKHGLEVSLAGIRWSRRGRAAPVAWTIVREGGRRRIRAPASPIRSPVPAARHWTPGLRPDDRARTRRCDRNDSPRRAGDRRCDGRCDSTRGREAAEENHRRRLHGDPASSARPATR